MSGALADQVGLGVCMAPEHELHLGESRSCGAWRGEEAGGNRGSMGVYNKAHRIVWNNIAYRMEFIKMTRSEDPETSPKTAAQQIGFHAPQHHSR
jgi:hypothetical protein